MEVRNLFAVFKNIVKVTTLIFKGDFKSRRINKVRKSGTSILENR